MADPTRDEEPSTTPVAAESQERAGGALLETSGATRQIELDNITILFSDIVGITPYFDRYGDLAGMKRISTHNDLLFPVIEGHTGAVVKTIGDAIMARFASPADGVQAAIGMQRALEAYNRTKQPESQIHIRIGLHCGQCVVEQRDVFGDAVNVGARISGKAGADQILISRAVADALEVGSVPFSLDSVQSLKGKEETFELYAVRWRSDLDAAHAGAEQPAGPEPPPAPAPTPAPVAQARSGFCSDCGVQVAADAHYCPACGNSIAAGAPEERLTDPLVGRTLDGKFRIQELLGEGAMGKVYKALQLSLDKIVCVKVLRSPAMQQDASLVRRFQREARAASRLSHPNSISVIDFGQSAEDGALYLAMEYVPGRDLNKIVAQDWPLPEERIVRIMDQVLSALADAHAAGIIHRDLKPENILVADLQDTKDFVKVLDFGIAKLQEGSAADSGLTQLGMVCGTAAYMSPEQARGEEIDPRSDIYSAGVILYQMVTGRIPFAASTPLGIITKHLLELPLPPSSLEGVKVSPALDAVILKALQKDREARYPTVQALRQELDAVLGQAAHETRAVKIHANQAPEAPRGGRRWLLGAVVLGGALSLGLGGYLLSKATPDQETIGQTDQGAPAVEAQLAPDKPVPVVAPQRAPASVAGVDEGAPAEAAPAPAQGKAAVEALEKELAAALGKLGVAPRDVPELDSLRGKMASLKAQERYAEALVVGRQAKGVAARVRIDRKLVDAKLVRFNQAFAELPAGESAAAEDILLKVMDALDRDDLPLANRLLNQAIGKLRKKRSR